MRKPHRKCRRTAACKLRLSGKNASVFPS